MSVARLSLQKNPFIGLFLRASERLVLCSKHAPQNFVETVSKALEVKAVRLFVDQSPLVGLLAVMNSNGVILPDFAEAEEIRLLKKEGLNVSRLACFAPGNNILANDRAALVSPLVPRKNVRTIADCLGVEVFQHTIAGINTVGSSNVVTNKGVFACNDASETDLKFLRKVFKAQIGKGTANLGSSCSGLCMAANSKGAAVGSLTTGFELQRIYDAFEYE
ncbi:hypothetical protein AUJ65_05360 [Candidatus Micrarchaeota archaeon CG1_02_51_15]|nr:MAG: hypothetical protein AUJ65_05360 [Candidatus Micrarchaeota archaeon CG1_02_51_15]